MEAHRQLPTPAAVVGGVHRTAHTTFSNWGFLPRTTGRPIRREVRVAGTRSQVEARRPGTTPEVVREAVYRTTRSTFSSWGFLPRTTGSTFRPLAKGAVARPGALSGPRAGQRACHTFRRTRQSRDSERHSSCRIEQPPDLRELVSGQPHRVAAPTEAHMPAATARKAELAARRWSERGRTAVSPEVQRARLRESSGSTQQGPTGWRGRRSRRLGYNPVHPKTGKSVRRSCCMPCIRGSSRRRDIRSQKTRRGQLREDQTSRFVDSALGFSNL